MISEYAKTPFDKASALKREEFCDSSSGRKLSRVHGVAAFGGFNSNKYNKFIGNNDEIKKELVFDNKASIGSSNSEIRWEFEGINAPYWAMKIRLVDRFIYIFYFYKFFG